LPPIFSGSSFPSLYMVRVFPGRSRFTHSRLILLVPFRAFRASKPFMRFLVPHRPGEISYTRPLILSVTFNLMECLRVFFPLPLLPPHFAISSSVSGRQTPSLKGALIDYCFTHRNYASPSWNSNPTFPLSSFSTTDTEGRRAPEFFISATANRTAVRIGLPL